MRLTAILLGGILLGDQEGGDVSDIRPEEVPAERLKAVCAPGRFKFRRTDEVSPLEGTIGQDRACAAIEFGLRIKTHGFNLYVAGPVGTGKNSTVRAFVSRFAKGEPVPPDICYLHNFADPGSPICVTLPPNKGCEFQRDMDELVRDCQREIPKAFEGEDYTREKERITSRFERRRDELLEQVKERAVERGFVIQRTPQGLVYIPVKDGKPIAQEEYEGLPEPEQARIREQGKVVQAELNEAIAEIRRLEKETRREARRLDETTALFSVGHLIDELTRKYKEHPRVLEYLRAVKQDIVEHIEDFRAPGRPTVQFMGVEVPGQGPSLERYRVNLLVDHSRTDGAPVVVEPNPTYHNLFGGIEYQSRFGAMVTNFTLIRPGALHRANHGYLILQVKDLLSNPFSWDGLKRALKSRKIRIENLAEQLRTVPASTLKPEPIPLDLKVILVGEPVYYHLLHRYDEDFGKLFKVRADFDTVMDRTEENMDKYAAFVSARCREEGLKPFDPTGVAKLVEYGAWLAGDQEKLSTRFIEVANIVAEANYWAELDQAPVVGARHVQQAIDHKGYRSSLIEEKIRELIEQGTLLIDLTGKKVGQVNGLALLQVGDYAFGKPSRITARVYVGRAGVIDIERETELSGQIHSKGVLILSGYLHGKYGVDRPLGLSASLCFEQLYEEVEGDSASSAELYCLLSALSGLPIRQGIAVTGSVNQQGEIQPIGGVARKIEGFFDVCKLKGLAGDQGVIIPEQNVRNLMLKDEVVEAVKAKRFHIYPVKTVDQGIELLTGVRAGKLLKGGRYEPGSVNDRVAKRLSAMARALKGYEPAERAKPRRKTLK